MAPAWIGWKGSKEGSAGMTGADAAAAGGGSDASGGGEHAPAPLHQQHLDGGASSSSVGSDPATLPSDGATDAEEAGRASSPRPEEDEERVGGRRQGLTVSISGLSLSSAGGEQEGQQEGPSPLISPRKTTPPATITAIPPSSSAAAIADSETTGSVSSSTAGPGPKYEGDEAETEEEEEEEEEIEAGGGGRKVVPRRWTGSGGGGDGTYAPAAAAAAAAGKTVTADSDLEAGNSMAPTLLLSPRSSFLQHTLQHGYGVQHDQEDACNSDLGDPSNDVDVRSSVSQMLEDLLHLPRWQYRLMIGSIIFLFSSLVILIILSTLYGFMLNMSHVKVTKVELALPFPHLDQDGNVPVTSMLLLSNSNPFPVKTGTTHVDIFADKNMTSPVGHATVPPMTLHAREEEHEITFNYSIPLAHTKNGAELVRSVLNKEASFFYTVSRIPVRVRALGLVPMTRHLKVNCEILRDWAHEGVLLSDCAARFV